MKIGQLNISGYVALAPMAGVADRAMREICLEHGAAYAIGELASAKGISLNDKKSKAYLEVSETEHPYGSQLFGCEPNIMKQAAILAETYKPDFIDINMGCPAPKVAISSGGGSALMKNPKLAAEIVKTVAKAVTVPITVKIRAGWDDHSKNAVELAKMVEQAGAAAITVHGRTRMQMYAPPVDIDIIRNVKNAVSIPVIANGDIDSAQKAAEMYEQTGCDFIMVGRAAMGNPWIFSQINAFLTDGTIIPPLPLSARMMTMYKHILKMCEYKGEKTAFLEARKHVAWYMKGIKGAPLLRREAGCISNLNDVTEIIKKAIDLNKE